MPENKSAVIVGAGVGGLVTAIFLARDGYKVTIFEKNSAPGGRCGQLVRDGYRFDLGATMLIMPSLYRRVFNALGIDLFSDSDIQAMDELYTLFFDDNSKLTFTPGQKLMKEQLEAIEPGSFEAAKEYVAKGYKFFQTGVNRLIGRNYDHLFQFVNLRNARLLIELKTYLTNSAFAKRYFKHPHLQMAYTFQNIYVGQSPFVSPALFAMVPAAELTEGSFFPKGGMHTIVRKLLSAATEAGVQIHYNTPVAEILTSKIRADGIQLCDGSRVNADVVVANADLPYVYRELLPDKSKSRRLDKLTYSCSAICFHWGIDKTYPQLAHHNIFLSTADFQTRFRAIFRDKGVGDNPSFYLHAPMRSDKGAAPDGHDAISVIVGAGHADPKSKQNWEHLKTKTRIAVIERLRKQGLNDIEEHIRFEACYLPGTWETACNISRGSVFGSLAHNMLQMGYFRPHNQHCKYKNLYFAGGSTQPGNGIPNVLLSGLLTSERILGKRL